LTERLVGSHLPDRFGGAKVAAVSLTVETLGQLLLWLAPIPSLVAIGLTGPALGLAVEGLGYPSAFLIGAGATLAALGFLRSVVGAQAKP
jgi:hypothetical protein